MVGWTDGCIDWSINGEVIYVYTYVCIDKRYINKDRQIDDRYVDR